MRLVALACHVPERRIEVEEIVLSAGGQPSDARVFTKLFGFEKVAAAEPNEPLEQHFAPALQSLEHIPDVEPPDALIYVHNFPVYGVGGQSPIADLCRSSQLLSSAHLTYEVDQNNCAGLFWALHTAHHLLDGGAANRVAIVAGDSLADLPLQHRYVPGSTVIGDAFAALLLDGQRGGIQIGDIVLNQRSEFSSGIYKSEDETRRFYLAHDEMVADALMAVEYRLDGQEALLPHNINQFVWMQFCRRHRMKLERVRLDLLPDVGHCCTTDPALLLHPFIVNSSLPAGPVTLLSIGLGGYTGACRVYLPGHELLCDY